VARAPRRLALLALLAAVAGAGGFLAGTHLGADEPSTRVELVACGLAPGPPPIDLPLARILREAPAGVSLGPFLLSGAAEPVTLRFEPLPEAKEKAARRAGSVVTLPVDLNRPERLDKVTLRCRYGAPAWAAFHFGPERLELLVPADQTPPEVPAS
jgi:hypothetical protein